MTNCTFKDGKKRNGTASVTSRLTVDYCPSLLSGELYVMNKQSLPSLPPSVHPSPRQTPPHIPTYDPPCQRVSCHVWLPIWSRRTQAENPSASQRAFSRGQGCELIPRCSITPSRGAEHKSRIIIVGNYWWCAFFFLPSFFFFSSPLARLQFAKATRWVLLGGISILNGRRQ